MDKQDLTFSAETRGTKYDERYYAARNAALRVLEDNSGVRLDIGCGEAKQDGFVGLDIRALDGVDIVWDMQRTPWPLPDECCVVIKASHILEHIKPQDGVFMAVMDELWRIMKPNGQLAIALPYAGSEGYYQDPTHVNPCNHATWQYFDPRYPLWTIYKPKPWLIEVNTWQAAGMMEVCLRKMTIEEATEREGEIMRPEPEDEPDKPKKAKGSYSEIRRTDRTYPDDAQVTQQIKKEGADAK